MRLYLVQHGAAKPESEDPQRSLTEEGRRTVERMAAWAAELGIQVQRIEHSTKLRARQTAEILATRLAPPGGTLERTGLAPNDDVEPVRERLEQETADLIIAGHLPFLSRLVSRLLGLPADQPVVRFQMGGIVCLERSPEGRWEIVWAVPPEIVR